MSKLADYKEHIVGDGSRFILFTADWCGPCKIMKPLLANMALDNPGFHYIEVNVERNKDIMELYNEDVRSIPMIVRVGHDGRIINSLVGSKPKSGIEEFLRSNGASIC